MTTFSQMVDKMVAETNRPDLITEIASYLNQTLRELHMEPTRGNAVLYRENLKEERIVSAVETGLSWTIPKVTVFQALAAAKFESVYTSDGEVWAEELTPGRKMSERLYYYYRAGAQFVFSGFGGVNASVALAWYEYVPYLKYYASNLRPAEYDVETGWAYADVINTPELQAAAELKTSNWILLRWPTVVEEGLRAKVYKRASDDNRARTSYSMYTTLRQGLYSSEAANVNPAR
jgi:hypothetical protein